MATEDLDLEAQRFVESARTASRLAAYRLANLDRIADALTRIVAYEELANNAATREEALSHFEAMEAVNGELVEIQQDELAHYQELQDDELIRIERVRAISQGDLKPDSSERQV